MKSTAILIASALLAACSQSEAPSEEMEKAAQEVVQAVEGSEAPEQVAEGPYAPRDECADLPGARQFLGELKSAIAARDAERLIALTAEDVKLDFGGGTGRAELRNRLAAEHGALWERLAPLTKLGCAVNSQGGMTLPWYFEQPMPSDPYSGLIVTGEDVPVREAPDPEAPVLARLSWEVVEATGAGAGGTAFRQVRVPAAEEGESAAPAGEQTGEKEGYIAQEHLRSLLDHRIIAASRNARWRIISLVAGD